MRIQIPDHLADDASVLGAKLNLELEAVIVRQLKAWGKLDPTKRVVMLDQALLDRIEKKVGGGNLTSGVDLAARVERLAGIAFMGRDLRLSPGQLEELARRAAKRGVTIDRLIEDVWQVLARDFFDVGLGGEAVVPIGEKAPHEGVNGTAVI